VRADYPSPPARRNARSAWPGGLAGPGREQQPNSRAYWCEELWRSAGVHASADGRRESEAPMSDTRTT